MKTKHTQNSYSPTRSLTYLYTTTVTMICLTAASSILSLTHLRLFSGDKKIVIIALSVSSLGNLLISIPGVFRIKKQVIKGKIERSTSNTILIAFISCVPFLCIALSYFNISSYQKLLCPRYFLIISKTNALISLLAFYLLLATRPILSTRSPTKRRLVLIKKPPPKLRKFTPLKS